ncbi:transporter substrate-binding domain-containing protein [Actinoplanes derwentensis]|uniref:Polar amino acid transport system substrate-binding protein n=1 Tax=Actinoplanes derwentensis TaxID=113562 RepID=A0A1H2DER2_9ACTN|nr:transporter substrate-binding domain-containing protein [Actinoplanes derwentensis]SDT80982.1 polar amino acid transport system substrate-binding protein [Actinoplanes derwentensis]
MRARTRKTIMLAAAVTLAITGCAKEDTGGTTDSGVPLIKAGALTTCTHLPYAPFQAKDASGKVVGFDVALIDLVATKLAVTQEIIDTPFEGIKSGADLNSGKCDVAAAGMTITDERKKVLDFSDPYFDATQALAVQTGKEVKTLEELAGKRVGTQGGTTGEDYIKKQVEEKKLDIEVVSYKDLAALQQALATNQVAAAVNDLPVWNEYIKANPGKVVVAAGFDTGEQYGFAVKKGNAELLKTVNEALAAARADGKYDEIYKTWIGEKPAA